MTLTIDITTEDENWVKLLPDSQNMVNKIVKSVLSRFEIKADEIELSVVLANDDFIQELNRDYRGKDRATNVLSFPSEELVPFEYGDLPPYFVMGDIILAVETVKAEAIDQEKSFHDHFVHLMTHGILHLLGFDHIKNDEAEQMEGLEAEILAILGVDNPY